jgi:hypothetical protein
MNQQLWRKNHIFFPSCLGLVTIFQGNQLIVTVTTRKKGNATGSPLP